MRTAKHSAPKRHVKNVIEMACLRETSAARRPVCLHNDVDLPRRHSVASSFLVSRNTSYADVLWSRHAISYCVTGPKSVCARGYQYSYFVDVSLLPKTVIAKFFFALKLILYAPNNL